MVKYLTCKRCHGLGYKGRWRKRKAGKVWKVEACPGCGGGGTRVQEK